MNLGLAGKTCLVTGASTGIGYAAAVCLAEEGAQILAAARSTASLAALERAIRDRGASPPLCFAANLANADGPASLASQVLAQVSHVDVLVNNAGASRPLSRPDDESTWEEAYRLNFVAARQLAQTFLPGMAERNWGRVINVSGAIVAKFMNAATPAKAALESWSKANAAFYAAKGVTVNCVAPGRITTPQILERLHPTEASRRDFIDRNIPAGRFGDPAEAAVVIAFLASALASYVNGVTVPVDGGSLRFAF